MKFYEGFNVVRKTFDEAARDKEQSAAEFYEKIFSPDKTDLDRILAVIGAIGASMPESFREKRRQEHTGSLESMNASLPIDTRELEGNYRFHSKEVGNGFDKIVFLLESRKPELPSLVLKFNTIQSGNNTDLLVERGSKIKKGYEHAREIYRELPGVVLDEYFFIGRHYWRDNKAVVSVQEFLGKDLLDVLDEANAEKIKMIIADHPKVGGQLAQFASITPRHAKEADEVVDLLGKNNLVLYKNPDGEMKLALLESEKFFQVNHPNASFKNGIARRLNRLESFQLV